MAMLARLSPTAPSSVDPLIRLDRVPDGTRKFPVAPSLILLRPTRRSSCDMWRLSVGMWHQQEMTSLM